MGDLKPESLTDREHPDANAVGNSLRKASLLGFRLERIPRKKGIPIGPIGTECGGGGGFAGFDTKEVDNQGGPINQQFM